MSALIGNIQARKWTTEHDDALKRLRKEGYSSSQIAGELWGLFRMSYSRNAVIGRAHRLGLTEPIVRRSPKQIAQPKRRSFGPVMPKFNPEEVALRCIEIIPQNLSLSELQPNDCRYPYGDGPFQFCGHPKREGSSYCGPHHAFSRKALVTHVGYEAQKAAARRTQLPTFAALQVVANDEMSA